MTPKNNSIALGNIIGKDYLSFTTSHGLEQIEFLLKECIIYYLKDDYKKDYGFVDNIKEIPKHNPITMDIHDSILLALKNKEIDKVWFAPPELIDWDKKLYFGLYKNRKPKNILSQVKKIDEIDLDNLHEYLIENGFNFSSIDDLKKFKVINILDDETEGESWNFYQCLYSSIKLENNKQYILNESNIYEVDNDFYNDYENKYLKLKLYASNLKYEGNMTETEFNSKVARQNPTYTLLDKKLVSKNKRSFEICDLFDNLNNLFIHVKKYGQSAVLSHLFSQAKVAADLFKDQSFRAEIINKMKEVNPSGKYDKLTYKDVEIVMAIITNKQIPSNGFVQIPFFSKVNVITTIDYIKNKYNYKNAGLMFIDLKELENENEINRDKN